MAVVFDAVRPIVRLWLLHRCPTRHRQISAVDLAGRKCNVPVSCTLALLAPRGPIVPLLQSVACPRWVLVGMADIACVRDLVFHSHRRWHEAESVRPDFDADELGRDLGHVTIHAFVARTTGFVMRVRLDTRGVGPVGRVRAVAFQAQNVSRLDQLCVI